MHSILLRSLAFARCLPVLALLLGGCASSSDGPPAAHIPPIASAPSVPAPMPLTPPSTAVPVSPAGYTPLPAQPPAYRLAPGDKVKIIVFREEQLSGEFEVDSTGRISMPLVGGIVAAGQTQQDIETQIAAKLRSGYIKDPKVSVLIQTYRPIYVLGEVKNAGEFPFKAGLNVVSAVALAGGFSYRADTTNVFIRRSSDVIERPYPANSSIPIYPGDTVRVSERYF